MNWLKTLRTNWRDLVAFLVLGLGLSSMGGLTDYYAARFGDNELVRLVTPSISNYLQGFAKFIGACIAASTLWMILWPTVSKFGNHAFEIAWRSLTSAQQFFTYLGLIGVALIAAAICFS